MRRVVCRFDDEADFLQQMNLRRHPGELQFLAGFALPIDEEVHVTALVSRSREQCGLRMRVVDARPLAVDALDGTRVFRYRVRVASEDAPWLEMFAQKMSTMRRVEAAA